MTDENNDMALELIAQVISAYVSKNSVPTAGLPALIASISTSIRSLAGPVVPPAPTPAVDPKRSVSHDHIVCLEDGKKFRSLKRHLASYHGLSPDEYRSKWNLPSSYPMAAPGYAAERSELAKKRGFGRKPATEVTKPVTKAARAATPARGRRAKKV